MRFVPAASRKPRIEAALALALAALAMALGGCAVGPRVAARAPAATVEARSPSAEADGPGANPPVDLATLADAEPRVEPIRAGGANKPYQALGRSFVPATADVPFSERGLASWYGRKFHGRRTASGEVYDMYSMTAAHPTLPIPSYARIRNPANGREVLVRVNDRGPFVAGRIVDLSYAAAFKLDLLRAVAPVELERITFDEIRAGTWRSGGASRLAAAGGAPPAPSQASSQAQSPAPAEGRREVSVVAVEVPVGDVAFTAAAVAAAAAPAPPAAVVVVAAQPRPRLGRAPAEAARGFWVQLGAFRERDGAENFRRRIAGDRDASWLEPLLAIFGDAVVHRVQAGPYPSRDEAEAAAQRARASLAIVPIVLERR